MAYKLGENIQREWNEEPQRVELWNALQLFETDPELAIEKLTKLGENGSALAMMYLGAAYVHGRGGIDCDFTLGEQWLSRSAEHGSIEGGFILGMHCWCEGDFSRAETELTKLCGRGYSPAMYRLGLFFFTGAAGEKDQSKGLHYLRMAEQAGHLHARHWLSNIYLKQNFGLLKKAEGVWKRIVMLVPFVRYMVAYPTSDRMRTAGRGWMDQRIREYKGQHGVAA
jgi:TPR repeat protein